MTSNLLSTDHLNLQKRSQIFKSIFGYFFLGLFLAQVAVSFSWSGSTWNGQALAAQPTERSECKEALENNREPEAAPWAAPVGTTAGRLKLLVSLLSRHSNIVTANLNFRRSLLETYSHVPEILESLGEQGADLETAAPRITRIRYTPNGETRFDEERLRSFLEARVEDLEQLDLAPPDRKKDEKGGDIASQIRHLKASSRVQSGPKEGPKKERFNEKSFKKRVRRLFQVLPLLFDADGNALFQDWKTDQERLSQEIRAMRPGDVENRYGDLLKEHLVPLIREISSERGMGQVRQIFEGILNHFLKREVRPAIQRLTVTDPMERDGEPTQKRSSEPRQVETRELSIESLPAWVGIVRGCYGGDCSILSVPFYPLVKGVRVHWIRKGPFSSTTLDSEPSGYALSVPVEIQTKSGTRTVPYLLTVNGATLTEVDVEMTVRAVVEDYIHDPELRKLIPDPDSREVILPDFEAKHGTEAWNGNRALVNTEAARAGMTLKPRQKVKVKFPEGWKIVDGYMDEHPSQYRNYYHGSRIDEAYWSEIPARDSRVIRLEDGLPGQIAQGADGVRQSNNPPPLYHEVSDLMSLPQIERAILGVQALQDDQKDGQTKDQINLSEILATLGVSEGEIQAAKPLTQVSKTRPLNLAEYQALSEEFGFGLKDLLNLKPEIRSPTLRQLYQESSSIYRADSPLLFSEHAIRRSPQGVRALAHAYGESFEGEVEKICQSTELSDFQVLRILQSLRPALSSGDLERAIAFSSDFSGTRLESWAKDAASRAFIRMNFGETRLGLMLHRELGSELGSQGPPSSSKARKKIRKEFVLHALRFPPPTIAGRASAIVRAFQAITQVMNDQNLNYEQAYQRWLSDEGGLSAEKARFLGLFLNQAEFDVLMRLVPETERQQVAREIDDFTILRLVRFKLGGSESDAERLPGRRGLVSRLRSWVRNQNDDFDEQTDSPESLTGAQPNTWPNQWPDTWNDEFAGLKLEAFEFITAPIGTSFDNSGVTFTMGSPPDEVERFDNETQAETTLTEPFQAQTAEVPQWLYELVVRKNPSHFNEKAKTRNHPVESVNHTEAEEMAEKLTAFLSELDPKHEYRLPTEAQWVLMARAGTKSAYSFGSDASELPEHAFYSDNSENRTHEVASKRPNPWGLYDMHGNVWEWCQDSWNGSDPLPGGTNPLGTSGSFRVLRGGSWYNLAQYARSAYRNSDLPGYRGYEVGLRLLRTAK